VALAPAAQATLPEGRATAGRLVAGAVAVWAVLTALGLLVTGALGDSWVGRVDRAVTRWFVGQRTGTWTTVADAASALAGTRAVLAVGLSAAVIALAVTSSRRPAVFVVVVLLGEVLLYGAVSQVVGRVRPTVADLTGNLPTGASWPSGHVAAAAALYGALAVLAVVHGRGRRRWTTMALPVLVAVAVAMSRLYVAAPYTTDVLAGLALGTAWVLLCARLLLRPASDGVGADAAGHGTDQMDAVQPGGRADRPG
jgi:undecaprenyl-diphosphatase